MFNTPLVPILRLYEFAREPVEKVRMRWRLDSGPKIFRSGNQPRPEISLPNSIDQHSGGGGAAWIDQPLGQAQPVSRRLGRKWMEDGRHSRLDLFQRAETIPAFK